MLKTCFAKSDRGTTIRDLFPISIVEKRRQEEVDIPSCVHMLDQISALPQKKKKVTSFWYLAGVTDPQQVLKVIICGMMCLWA